MPGKYQSPADFKRNSHPMILKWLKRYYPINHTSVAYLGIFGIWDVLGKNELDQHVVIHGRTEQLEELKDRLCEAIDKEIERRQSASLTQ